jgi:hypothetical protein
MLESARWISLPIEDGDPRPRLFEGDVYRVRDEHGEVRLATYERSPGGGHGFYDDGGEPIDAHAVEVSYSSGLMGRR